MSESIDDLIEEWHQGGDEVTRDLHEFLGMTWKQYKLWAETGVVPEGWDPKEGRRGLRDRRAGT